MTIIVLMLVDCNLKGICAITHRYLSIHKVSALMDDNYRREGVGVARNSVLFKNI